MHTTIVCVVALAACGGGATRAEPPVAKPTEASAAPAPRPPAQPRSEEMIAGYRAYANTLCACVDLPMPRSADCVQAATNAYERQSAPYSHEKLEPAELVAFAKASEAASRQITDCLDRLARASAAVP